MTRSENGEHRIDVLLVSPLPPPIGGIASWTSVFEARGLPEPYRFQIYDSSVTRKYWFTPARFSVSELTRFYKIVRDVRRQISTDHFSLLHLSSSISDRGILRDWAVVRSSSKRRVPSVIELHGLFTFPTGSGPLQYLARKAYVSIFAMSDRILVLNKKSADAVAALGPFAGKTVIETSVIDAPRYPAAKYSDRPTNLRLVFVGANTESKGVFRALEILSGIDGASLTLLGSVDDDTRRQILQESNRMGVTDRIDLRGAVPHEKVLEVLAESDVFLFPTEHPEGFPLAVAEAMAVGLPVISSFVGAIPEMVEDGSGGFIIDTRDLDGYVSALQRLRDEPELRRRLGEFNRDKAISTYDHAPVARRLADLYSEVLVERASG